MPDAPPDSVHPVDLGEIAIGEITQVEVSPLRSLPLAHEQEKNAKYVASMLLWVFAFSMLAVFITIGLLLGVACRVPSKILTDVVPALDDFTRLIESVGTVFSPLLAFILGFYFNDSRKRRDND